MFGLLVFFVLQVNSSFAKMAKQYSVSRTLSYGFNFFTITLVAILLAKPIMTNISDGMKKLRQPYVTIKLPTVLQGLKVTKKEAKFYQSIDKALKDYLAIKPKTRLITIDGDAIYLTFIPNNRNFHPAFISYPQYPGYNEKLNDFIKKEGPIIITFNSWKPEGYVGILKTDYLSLIAPALK